MEASLWVPPPPSAWASSSKPSCDQGEETKTGSSQTKLSARLGREAPTEAGRAAVQWDCRVHAFHTRAKTELCPFHTVLRWQLLSRYVRNNAGAGRLVSCEPPPSLPSTFGSCTTSTTTSPNLTPHNSHHMEDCRCRQAGTVWKNKKTKKG